MADIAAFLHEKGIHPLVVVLVVGVVILVLLWRIIYGGRAKRTVSLIIGASGSGKTTLFYQLRGGFQHQGTVPSMLQNEDSVVLYEDKKGGKKIRLVDVPGHMKARAKAREYYSQTSKIVFLVDAVEFMAQKSVVAEHLYEVLSDPVLQKSRVPVMIVCNKMDETLKAHNPDFIRKRLEKEMDGLRESRASMGDGEGQEFAIAKEGEPFSFSRLKGLKVSIGKAAALTGDVDEIVEFLAQ